MRRYLFTLVLLTACSPGLFAGKSPGTFAQDGYSILQTNQNCIESEVLVGKIDTILTLLGNELVQAGIVKSFEDMYSKLRPHRLGCLIPEPAQCTAFGTTLGPCKDGKLPCARKRGCAINSAFWVSRWFPPVCKPGWLNEPHCVATKDDPKRNSNFESDLVHEVVEMVGANLNLSQADHKTTYYTVIGAAVTKAYLEGW